MCEKERVFVLKRDKMEDVCVCVSERERGRKVCVREDVCVCVREDVCVCVCDRERKKEL
jgi:hypothetical protein